MKNLTILFILFIISGSGYAQLEVDADGHVGIISSPDTDYELKIEGKTNILGADDDWPDLKIFNGEKGYSSVVDITGSSYYSSILRVSGTTNNGYTFSVSGTAYCSGGQWSGSDERLKKNITNINSREILPKLMKLKGKKNNCCNKETDNSNTTKSATNDKEEMPQAILYNNQPNPFSESTEIRYYLPDNINVANIYIYDMNGVQIKSFEITDRGHGQLIIAGTELQAGMYMYSLIADGIKIDTKQMILTK